MTAKQIEVRQSAIYDTVYHGGVRVGKYHQFTEEQKRELNELSCRKMINSILIYDGENGATNEESYSYKQYLKSREKEVGGKKRMQELVAEQIEDFRKAICGWDPNSYDVSGGPYKYCKWADEQ